MGEHAQRYRAAVGPLLEAGVVVYANDHRGHGRTAPSREALGDFGAGGFALLVDDMARLTRLAKAEHPGVPLILLGHSMGSFAAQQYVLEHSDLIDGLVLSGSAALDKLMEGGQESSASGLEAFNAAFEPARTPFDWLSRDPAVVDAYIKDPYCGFTVLPDSMASMFVATARMADPHHLQQVRRDLPIYVFAGDTDPVSARLAWLHPLIDRYRAAGLADITVDFYPGGRHEMLNEINRDEVVGNLLAWMRRIVA